MRIVRLHPILTVMVLIVGAFLASALIVGTHFDKKNRDAEEYVGSVLARARTLNDLPKSFVDEMREGRYEEELAVQRGVEILKGQKLLYWSRSEIVALVLVEDTSGTAKIKKWWIRYI